MDTFSATPQLLPRLRVSRASPSGRRENGNASVASSSQAGPSRLTDFTQLVDLNLSDIRAAHAYSDEDEDDDQYPTPRMNTTTPLVPSSATPTPSLAGRLRELIHLVPNGSASQATPTLHRPPSPTFHESDFEGESTAAAHSRARESLRDIFSKALREPGDTPQKGRPRRNSDSSASENDFFPASSRKLPDIKGKRKSLSDEESLTPLNSASRNTHHTDAQQHTTLRSPRDTNPIDFPLRSISAEDSDDADEVPRPRRISPVNTTSNALQSLRISQNSDFPHHSNLLDQDSEMQREFGEVESSDDPSMHSSKPQYRAQEVAPPPTMPSTKESPFPEKLHTTRHARMSLDPNTSYGNQSTSTAKPTPRPHDRFDSTTRDARQRRTSLQGSTTPALKRKSSSSLQFSDQSSAMSISDYVERTKETERERKLEREREWNKPHHKIARPSSGLSFHSPRSEHRTRTSSISSLESPRPGSALSNMSIDSGESPRTRVRTSSSLSEHPGTYSGGNRPGSALSNDSPSVADFPQNLRRHHSLTSRADSPVSSQSAASQVEEAGIEFERERNWNAPRPKWHRRSLPNTPDRPASPGPSKLSSPHSSVNHRRESTTPTAAFKDTSNITRSGSSLTRRHSQPKPITQSPSLVERRGVASSNVKSPHSRLSVVATSTPARSRSPIPGQSSQHKSRLPVPSARTPASRQETPRPIPAIQIQAEGREVQSQSSVSIRQAVNGQSLSQESMELTEAYNGQEMNSALPSFSEASEHIPMPNNNTMHTASLLGLNDSRATMYQTYDEDEENFLAQERTPTLQTIEPPLEESHEEQAPDTLPIDETPEIDMSTHGEPEPLDANHSSSGPSFLSTPPRSRQSSFNSSKPEYQTPSPPKGLPDLPEPPSGDETDESLPQFNITPAHINATTASGARNGHGDMTTFKTPKPPGAWFATPGPSLGLPPSQEDSTRVYVNLSDDGLLKAKAHSQSIFSQTPAAPGGWMNTPAARHRAHSDPRSTLNENGLTTPVASLGRANTMPPKTPAPPGGWVNTPGTTSSSRKSVLKVRFDPDVTSSATSSSDLIPENFLPQINGSSVGERSTTPEPVTPATPPSRSPRKHKRSPPSVRVVDAYGNEQKQNRARNREASSPTPSTPRNRSGVRIVDSLGQEVKGESEEQSDILDGEDTEGPNQNAPMTRLEALQRVRQGIQELADGIESLDWSSQSQDDTPRIRELDETSRALKQSREQVARDIHRAEKELRRQVRQRVLMSTFLGRNAWFLFFVGVVQLVLIFIMYRASVLRARKLFLTNYYDPFNPDLFLYTTNPDTQYAPPTTSWGLVTQAVRSGDLTAFTGAFRENLSTLVKRWHQQIWDVWGDDPTRLVGAWPPT